jgi:RNA polymerase sigma-70 factor, ECF subfamily
MDSMREGKSSELAMPGSTVDILHRIWHASGGERFGFGYPQFEELMLEVAASSHWGLAPDGQVSISAQSEFLANIRARDLVLARACAMGHEQAWEVFLTEYRETLYSSAYAITGDNATGRELADSLYAELFGMTTRDGRRRSKLDFYTGRGSLAGWLRSVLARRYIDDYRKTRRLVSLDERIEDGEADVAVAAETPTLPDEAHRIRLGVCVGSVLAEMECQDRFLLRTYYLDGRSLAEIAKLLGVHESTISRRVKRLGETLRQRLLKKLQASGLSRRAAEEALSGDVQDLDVNVKELLQVAEEKAFQNRRVSALKVATGEET